MRSAQSNTTTVTQNTVDLRTIQPNSALRPENVGNPKVLVLRLRGESSENTQIVLNAIVPYDQNAHSNYDAISVPSCVLSTDESTRFLNLNRLLSENLVDNRVSRIPHDDEFSVRIDQILENRDFGRIIE